MPPRGVMALQERFYIIFNFIESMATTQMTTSRCGGAEASVNIDQP